MRATSASSYDAGASGGEFGGGALRLEESVNSFTLITVDTFLRYHTRFAVTIASFTELYTKKERKTASFF